MSGNGTGVGDLGRRVAARRQELGLSIDALASRAGMSGNYLRTLESSESLQPSRAAMWNLAAALDCPLNVLTGSGMECPPGQPQPSSRQHIEALTSDECAKLVAAGGIGRFIFSGERGPVAWPVNFRILNGDVVFRTESSSSALRHLTQTDTSFEVDRLDEALTEGWSVLMTGQSRMIGDPAERALVESLGVQPWATGPHEAYVRLSPRTITGRRIRREHVC